MDKTTSGLYAFITNLPVLLFCAVAEDGWLFPGAVYGLIVVSLYGAIYEAQGEGAKNWEKKGGRFFVDIATMLIFTLLFVAELTS